MLELLLCSLVTIFPDYLFRRYGQGKRLGHEITLYSVWYELRWGIVACLVLTVTLITVIFYHHPATKNVTAVFRTVTILPESGGRVAEVFVGTNEKVKAGTVLFRLDDTEQQAALSLAKSRIAEIDAQMLVARNDLNEADAMIQQAESAHLQAKVELDTKLELRRRNANVTSEREIERLEIATAGRKGAVDAAHAAKESAAIKIRTLLPAQKASAEAELARAQSNLDKTVVRAGISGTVQQFTLRPGDVVSPVLRPAGILVPEEAGRRIGLIAGFNQIEAQVMRPGMIAEVTCIGKPFTVIPMVVTEVQDVIASGQFRPTDQLIDARQLATPGTLTVYLEPLYSGQLTGIPPGSSCIANAYTNNHEMLEKGNLSLPHWLYLHMVDAVAVVHALILRLQALLLPVQVLVFGGH